MSQLTAVTLGSSRENPPVGLILCQVLAREYQLNLPNEAEIAARIDAVRRLLSAAPDRLERPSE